MIGPSGSAGAGAGGGGGSIAEGSVGVTAGGGSAASIAGDVTGRGTTAGSPSASGIVGRAGRVGSLVAPTSSSAVRSCPTSISPCRRNRWTIRAAFFVSSGVWTFGARLIGFGSAIARRTASAGESACAE